MKKEKKAIRSRNMRRLRYGTASTVVTVVIIAAVILLNVIVGIVADRFPVTLDLSKDQVFSLSDESVAIAKQVKNDVDIVVFAGESNFTNSTFGASQGVPEYDTTMREFHNALRQYETYSGGKIKCRFIDPDQQPAEYAAYSSYEVETGDILFVCGERSKTSTVDDLFQLDSSNYSYTGSYSFESRVERTLGANIHSLTTGDEHLVQVLVGHSEDSNTISGLRSLYELNGYAFEELSITGSAQFNDKAEVLLIAAPEQDYSSDEVKRVQQWLYNDGNYGRQLMVFVNPTASCPNLYDFLKVEYQITVTDELLLETDLNRIQSYNPLYTLCDVPDTDFTGKSSGTAQVFTPQARRLTTTLSEQDTEGTVSTYGVTLTSYPTSAQLIKLKDYADQNSEGTYKAEDDAYPLTSMIACVINGFNTNTQEYVRGTALVSGCPFMAYSTFTSNGSFKNEELLLDTINTLADVEDGITISSKTLSTDKISFAGGTQIALGLVFALCLPVVILIISLVIFLRRKNL